MKRIYVLLAVIALVAFMPAGRAAADNENNNNNLQAVPFEYVGKAGDCGTGYPAGSRIVTAAWLGGMGLPDNGGDTAVNGTPGTRNDPHSGLLLSKNGLTTDCSSSGAQINGVKGMVVGTTATPFIIGFDYRGGGHCGAGAPRFNVVSRLNGVDTNHFFGGCANGASIVAPQDPQWYRVRFSLFDPAVSFPPAAVGSKIVSIDILYDEGTDTPSIQDPMGVGLAVLDNIYINGQYIRSGPRTGSGNNGRAKDKNKGDSDNEGDD